MALNLVNVTVSAIGSPIDATEPEGNYTFVPSGTQWPSTDGVSAVVPAVIHGQFAANTDTATVQLVASDNFSQGVLTWNVLINIRGLPTINVRDVPVNYADGASQNIFTILTNNAGWIPVES